MDHHSRFFMFSRMFSVFAKFRAKITRKLAAAVAKILIRVQFNPFPFFGSFPIESDACTYVKISKTATFKRKIRENRYRFVRKFLSKFFTSKVFFFFFIANRCLSLSGNSCISHLSGSLIVRMIYNFYSSLSPLLITGNLYLYMMLDIAKNRLSVSNWNRQKLIKKIREIFREKYIYMYIYISIRASWNKPLDCGFQHERPLKM